MKFRLAKHADCRQLAQIALTCSEGQDEGFTFKLGKSFLEQYYHVVLEEKHSVIVCAVDDHDPEQVLGFVCGSLEAQETMRVLRRSWLRLSLAAVRGLIRRPHLIPGLIARYRALWAEAGDIQYVVSSGPRLTYWGMRPQARSGPGGLLVFRKWLGVMSAMGARKIRAEIDLENTGAQQAHRLFGARAVLEFVTPDGRSRVMMEHP